MLIHTQTSGAIFYAYGDRTSLHLCNINGTSNQRRVLSKM